MIILVLAWICQKGKLSLNVHWYCHGEHVLRELDELAFAACITVQASCLYTCNGVSVFVSYQFFLFLLPLSRVSGLRLD